MNDDRLAPARGVLIGVVLSVPLWVGLYLVGRLIAHVAGALS